MYRLVTFRLPPAAASTTDGVPMSAKIFEGLLKPVTELNPQVPEGLADLIHKCIAFNPNQRPERMSEIQGALDHLAEDLVLTDEDKLDAMEW